MANQLDHAVYQTIRYFDIFELPVTATQMWQCLLVEDKSGEARWAGRPVGRASLRWAGHRNYSLGEIQEVLVTSPFLRERLDSKWGYYFLRDKRHLVRERLSRHVLAQEKWKIMKRAARYLALVPFVKALSGSGSLAVDNPKTSSDLDLFVIVSARRIWLARLGLLAVSQLLGRRRKYWNEKAPDKICLNHYIADDQLTLAPDLHNIYMAVLCSLHVPLYGRDKMRQFREANGSWIRRYVMSPDMPDVSHIYTVRHPRWLATIKGSVESFFLEPIGNLLEKAAERVQRWFIARHGDRPTQLNAANQASPGRQARPAGRPGRIVIGAHELAFHPDTKVPSILEAFYQDPGQRRLL